MNSYGNSALHGLMGSLQVLAGHLLAFVLLESFVRLAVLLLHMFVYLYVSSYSILVGECRAFMASGNRNFTGTTFSFSLMTKRILSTRIILKTNCLYSCEYNIISHK